MIENFNSTEHTILSPKKPEIPLIDIYQNRKSKLHQSIIIEHYQKRNFIALHLYALIISRPKYYLYNKKIIDLRSKPWKEIIDFQKHIDRQDRGSLSFTRLFITDPKRKEYEEKIIRKYPEHQELRNRRIFSPLLVLMAHYCDFIPLNGALSEKELQEIKQEAVDQLGVYIKYQLHPSLKPFGRVLYLSGEASLLNYHQTQQFPPKMLDQLLTHNMIHPVSKLPIYNGLSKDNNSSRKRTSQKLTKRKITTDAITHLLTNKNRFLPLNEHHFPIAIVGEPTVRRKAILNLLKNANARLLILDPANSYGRLAMANPRIQGFVLGKNYLLNIASTETSNISNQLYAYWFSKIIAHVCELRSNITKTIETYLLGAFREQQNEHFGGEITFRALANQELTSEVTKMTRSDACLLANILYPLGTYNEISIMTKLNQSQNFDMLFDTKGSVVQFDNKDKQLTALAYLFTLLKLQSFDSNDKVILVLDNADEYLSKRVSSSYQSPLLDLVLQLPSNFMVLLGIRSPSKIPGIFKEIPTKIINRLSHPSDFRLFEKEYNINENDISLLNRLTDQDFFLFLPEVISYKTTTLFQEPNTEMRIRIDKIEEESTHRILHSHQFLKNSSFAPEIHQALFEILKLLRERPHKLIPEEGFENILEIIDSRDILRAKELALDEAFIKIVETSPSDSSETINLIKLTERGDDYYQSYLDLSNQIPSITIKTLRNEKDFQEKIFKNLSAAKAAITRDDNKFALQKMSYIVLQLLAVFPEKERYISGTTTAQLFNCWSYLSSLKENKAYQEIRTSYDRFSRLILNSLKRLKNNVLSMNTANPSASNSSQSNTHHNPDDEESISFNQQFSSSEAEAPFSELDEMTLTTPENSSEENQLNFTSTDQDTKSSSKSESIEDLDSDHLSQSNLLDDSSSSLFKVASDELKASGLSHRDSNGEFYNPGDKDQSENQLSSDQTEIRDKSISENDSPNSDPFAPINTPQKNRERKKEREVLDNLYEHLLARIEALIDEPAIYDPKYALIFLNKRFRGILKDGYTISEIIWRMKKLSREIEEGAILDEKTIKELKSLISSPKLCSETLLESLKPYLKQKKNESGWEESG
jgi:hypothetical protein